MKNLIKIVILLAIMLTCCDLSRFVTPECVRISDGFSYYADEIVIEQKISYDYWQTPKETEERGGGDCEDTALWLYYNMRNQGYHVKFACGKRYRSSSEYHAWVELHENGRIYILDPSWHEFYKTKREYGKKEYVNMFDKFQYFQDNFTDWKFRTYGYKNYFDMFADEYEWEKKFGKEDNSDNNKKWKPIA